jgi:hypothetical protein
MFSVAAREGVSGSADFNPGKASGVLSKIKSTEQIVVSFSCQYTPWCWQKGQWAKNERGRRTSGSSIKPKMNRAPSSMQHQEVVVGQHQRVALRQIGEQLDRGAVGIARDQ